MQLIKDIFRVAATNIITLVSNVIIGIILPIYISVAEYGEYRSFLFYASYIGLLHFGFIDAIYLKYGGITKETINKTILKKEHVIFLIYQTIISFSLLLIAVYFENPFFIILSLIILPNNIASFHKLFYQATGQFKKYAFANIMQAILNMSSIICLIFLDFEFALNYIIVTSIVYFMVLLVVEKDFYSFVRGVKAKGKVNILSYNKIGIFVLIGNICAMLITNIGLWMVQFFFTIEDFAQYAFAVSMMNMILLGLNAVGLTLYNYMAKREDENKIIFIKESLLVIGALAGSAYFVVKLIVNYFLPDYRESLTIIAISFCMIPYLIVINIIVINLYKVQKKQQRYFEVVIKILILSIFLNAFSVIFYKSMQTLTIATLIVMVLWYIYSTHVEFPFLKGNKKELVFLMLHAGFFYFSVNYFEWMVGLILYIFGVLISAIVLYSSNNKYLIKKIISFKKSISIVEREL